MCTGNRAAAATYWVNQQLASLWKLSVDCADEHGYGIKPLRPEVAYGTCLAQLCVGKNRNKPRKDDLLFFSRFEAPRIQFICNHDVFLFFKLKSGYFKKDGQNAIENFQDYTCVFRVPFRQHLITDVSYSKYGQTDACKAKFLVLDLDAAEFVNERSEFGHGHDLKFREVDRKQRVIVKYLRAEYFPLLRRSGFHFIHNLPDFDILARPHQVDWSAVTEANIGSFGVCGVNVEVINSYLRYRWLEAAKFVDALDDDHDHGCFGNFALAEHRGACDDFYFHAFFGPPQIRVLCSKEVVFIMDVQSLHIYTGGEFKGEATKFSNLKIAIIAELSFVEEGDVRRLRLNFSNARYCKTLSSFGKYCEEELFLKIQSMFIHYMSFRYLFILEEFGYDYIYRSDFKLVEEQEYIEEEDVEFLEEFRERVCITETFGFDTLTAVTQASINCHFHSLWKAALSSKSCLSRWLLDKNFEASFGAIQLQLPCNSNDPAIVYFVLREGALALLDCNRKCVGGEMHRFSNWKVAFEVKIRLRESREPHAISDPCLREKASAGEYVNYQLVLDFETAKFRRDLSRLCGLYDDSHFHLTRSKHQALVYYMTHSYFAELERQGHHVLYTFPVWKAGSSCGFNRFAPTVFSFQFYGPSISEGMGAVSSLVGRHRHLESRNMIVICGMVDKKSQWSFPLPPCTWIWRSSQDTFAGTIALSRKIFLEGWLLQKLSRVNSCTTLIPVVHGISDGGEWQFELVTLEEHEKEGSCEWNEVAINSREIEFEHQNKETWTYDHVGDACDNHHDGGYSISCKTVNKLVVPTVSERGVCEIKLSGKVTLELTFKGKHKSWSTSAAAWWSYTICMANGPCGHGLQINTSKTVKFSEGHGFMGHHEIIHPGIKDATTHLKEKLADMSIVDETTLEELKTSFCDVWPLFYSGSSGYTLRNPVFNQRGDLIFELESPIDLNGQIAAQERHDICIPGKHLVRPSISITGNGSHESNDIDISYSAVTTTSSLLRTPSDSPTHAFHKIEIRSEAESPSEDGKYLSGEKLRHTSCEKVCQSREKWDGSPGKPKVKC